MDQEKFILPMPTKGYAQPNSKSCWYACYAMMYGWKNKTDYELDQKLAAGGFNLWDIKNRGLAADEYRKVAYAVGTREVQRMSALNWSIEDVVDRLQRWGPIFLCTKELGGGHAMVLYGVDITFSKLIIADPYTKSLSADTEYFTLNKFRGTIQPVDYAVQCF